MTTTATEWFRQNIKGRNIITPETREFGWADGWPYELSTGTGMAGEPLWGVSFGDPDTGDLRPTDPERVTDGGPVSRLFFSEADARAWIAQGGRDNEGEEE